jgi:ADP-heptose:LPS heptosyltransferase
MYRIIISPYSRRLRGRQGINPKNYPYWSEVIKGLKEKDIYVTQVGVQGEDKIEGVDEFLINKSLDELKQLVKECDTWISIDNFFQHLGWLLEKSGIAIFGQSDPIIFGHETNENILKDRKYLRPDQFGMWESIEFNKECFIEPNVVVDKTLNKLDRRT